MFTVENARAWSELAHEKRRQNARDKANPPPQQNPQCSLQSPQQSPDEFLATRLARVRRQLDMIDRLIEAERLPQALDRLAAASAKLSEQERVLSDRPLPGSRRPPNPRRSRLGSAVDTVPE